MRDYMKEINECSERIGALKERQRELHDKISEITNKYGNGSYRRAYANSIFYYNERDMLNRGHMTEVNELRELCGALKYVESQIFELLEKRDDLKEAYRIAHTCSFYRPMDDYDIQDFISRNGSIKGTKL